MTSEEIIAVIDNLCEKLGLAVSSVGELVPELAAWKATVAGFSAIVAVLVMALSAGLVVWAYREGTERVKEYNANRKPYQNEHAFSDEEVYFLLALMGIAAMVVAFVVLIAQVIGLIGWVTAPNARAIEYILSLVG